MKDIYVIVANPNLKESISYEIGLKALKQIKKQKKKIEIKIINLYDFEIPFYKASRKSAYKISQNQKIKLPKDLQKIVDEIKDYKTYIFIYPIWWSNMPAILKNFFDWSVFFGMEYDFKGGKKALHRNKKAFLITACGADDYSQEEKKQMIELIKLNILPWWGIKKTDSLLIDGTYNISEKRVKKYAKKCQEQLLKILDY